MNQLEEKIYNSGERLVPYVSHDDDELVKHRSSYSFFYDVINTDQKSSNCRNISIVDIGFGSGWGAAMLSGINNAHVIGVDVEQDCLIYAEQNYGRKNVEYIIRDAVDFVDNMDICDYVVSRGVLEHVPGGLSLIEKFKYKQRVIVDVPYNEKEGNDFHILLGITENDFKSMKNCEIFYEDINGAIYKDYCPKNVNMIMVVVSRPGLKKVGEMFKFPIMPVRTQEKELLGEINLKNRVRWMERDELVPEVIKKIKPVLVGLDIGTGIVPHDYLKAAVYVCCEPYAEYINVLTEKISGEKDQIFVINQGDWLDCVSVLECNSVDSVYLIDVIEHLPKEDGEKLLKITEKIAKKQIVIFTPLGLVEQETLKGGKDAWGLSGAEYQEHKSGWMPEDFDETWDVYACKNFHTSNNIGEKIEKPFGAFWAIKNLNENKLLDNADLDPLFSEIRNALVNQLPNKYFELIEKNKSIETKNQQLQTEHDKIQNSFVQLQSEQQQLQIKNNQLQVSFNRLENCRAVRCGNIINKYFKKIGM